MKAPMAVFRDRTEGTNATYTQLSFTPLQINCKGTPGMEITPCNPQVAPCLFDVVADPCEQDNLAATNPDMVAFLTAKVAAYNETAVPPERKSIDPASDPRLWNNDWVPWLDPSPLDPPNNPWSLSSPPFTGQGFES